MERTECTLCHSIDQTVIRDTLRYDIKRKVLKCNACSFVFLEAKPADSPEFYAGKTYRETYGPDLKKASNAEDVFNTYFPYQGPIINEIKHLLTPETSILDVGCSAGQFLASLKGMVQTRVGLELSQNEVEFIKTHLDFPAYNEPIETVSIKEGPFDIVTALQVVEHVPDPVSFVKHLGKQLKPGGVLYLELPNLNDAILDCYQIPGYAKFYFREPHVSYFTKDTLKNMLDQAGFEGEIKNVQRYNFINHLNWVLTGGPQDNFTMGNGTPKLVTADIANTNAKTELNNFIARVDREYQDLIIKLGLGESLTFVGKLKK